MTHGDQSGGGVKRYRRHWLPEPVRRVLVDSWVIFASYVVSIALGIACGLVLAVILGALYAPPH